MPQLTPMEIDAAAVVNMTAALIVALIGAGVTLYERFSIASLRLALLTSIVAAVLVCSSVLEALGGPEAAGTWFRLALAFDGLLVPAVYALAIELAGARRPLLMRAAWTGGGALATWSVASPTLADSVLDIGRNGILDHHAAAGGLLILFMVALLAATVAELVCGYRRAAHAEDRKRVVVLAGGFVVGSLSMIDFFLYPQPFAGGITPLAVIGAVLVFGYASMRFRAFSPLPAFAADRILQVMRDGVLLCDEQGRIRNANRAACELLGMSERTLAGTLVNTILVDPVPESGHAAEAGTEGERAPLAGATFRDREMVLVPPAGAVLEVSVSSELLRQGDAVVGSVVVFRDIRERLRAARALRATEQRYHSLFWNNPALVYEVDHTGTILQANPAVERVLGVDAANLVGRSFLEFIHPDDIVRAGEAFGRVLSGEGQDYRFRLLAAPSTTLQIKGVSIPIIRDGAVAGVFGVAIDITEEERVRRELELQKLEFAALFEASPEAILIADENNAVVRVNPEFTRTFGYTPEEAAGAHVTDLLVPPELLAEAAELTEGARRGEIVRAETVRRCRDGSHVDVSLLARELKLPGRPPQLYGIYRDITARKRAEQSLRERDEELRHAQRLDSVGKLAGGVAHDFNNLVTVIGGHVTFALEALPPDHPVRHDLVEVQQAGVRAANLTQQLLAFSRRQVLRPETVDATTVVADVQRMMQRIIGEHIRIETTHAGDARLRADRGQLEQLLVNLVVNARDAMSDGGVLTISTDNVHIDAEEPGIEGWDAASGAYVRISVADTGVGMDEATRSRAFDPFFTTKEHGKGTGLGLATVFGIVKQSGGHVTAASAPGRGTTIRVWLPAAAEGNALPPAVAAPQGCAAASVPHVEPATGARILLVEDEAALRELAARVLRRAGHTVLLAEDGAHALALAARHRVDLVVSDLVMPRMGGRDLARSLRASMPDLPIVLMSGYDDEVATEGTSESILSKPFTPAELADRVATALAGRLQAASAEGPERGPSSLLVAASA